MSTAAFRRDPHDPAVWADLFSRGLKDDRIAQLAVFTAIDIRATNLDAWNDWKSQLLHQLVKSLESPLASSLGGFLEFAEKKKERGLKKWAEQIDSAIVERVPWPKLLDDFNKFKSQASNKARKQIGLQPLVVQNRRKELWVRFHSWSDQPGLFLTFARLLLGLGLDVQEAYVQTFTDLGAYDWFRVKSKRSARILQSQLKVLFTADLFSLPSAATAATEAIPNPFAVVEIVSENDQSTIVSFRGRDRRGALMTAAQMIFAEGFEIRAAKVHTWGRQIDDVFTLKKATPGDRRIREWVAELAGRKDESRGR